MQTLSGRLEIADKVLQQGLVTNLKGYFAVMEGAPPEELYKNELSQEDLVNRENEALIKGEEVKVLNIDDHAYHLMMHSIPLNDPKVRLNKELAGRFLSHILEHSDQARQIDPFFAAMVQTGKMPEGGPPPPPMMGPPGMGAPPGQGGPPGAEGPMGARGGGPPPPGTSAGPAKPAMDQLSRASGG